MGALDGKVALVTGASKGIGLGHGHRIRERGGGRDDLLTQAGGAERGRPRHRGRGSGARVETFAANAGEPEQAEACVAATLARLGAIDVLVNNAATNPVMGRTIDADLDAWDKTFRVNVRGALVWTQLAWRSTMQEHGGAVINISSVGGISGTSGIGAYNITKAALIHLTKVLAVEMAPKVRVNAIAPGLVKTDFAASALGAGRRCRGSRPTAPAARRTGRHRGKRGVPRQRRRPVDHRSRARGRRRRIAARRRRSPV